MDLEFLYASSTNIPELREPPFESQFQSHAAEVAEGGQPFLTSHARREWKKAIESQEAESLRLERENSSVTMDAAPETGSRELDEFNSAEASVMIVGSAALGFGVMRTARENRSVQKNPAATARLNRAARLMRKWLEPRGVSR